MKILVKILSAALVLVIACSAAISFSARTVNGIRGDTDNDGAVTIMDATRVQRTLAELYDDADGLAHLLGNIVGDSLDILDATRIQRYLADFQDGYQIGEPISIEIADPTEEPTIAPTDAPTDAPTEAPTQAPTKRDPYELPPV